MKRLKCLLNAEKFYVLVLEELQFHSCGGTHCETMIINFCVVPFCCSCGRIFEFVEEQRLSYAYSSPHTHTHTHTHTGLVLIFRFVPIQLVLSLFPVTSLCFSFFCENIFFWIFFLFPYLCGFHVLICVSKLCSFVYYVTKKCEIYTESINKTSVLNVIVVLLLLVRAIIGLCTVKAAHKYWSEWNLII